MNMARIKVKDLAYGRLRSPDLDAAEEFLTHFGMIRAARTPTALYMRGTDPSHHLHVTEKGDPAFVGFAYHAASEDDLGRVAKAPRASPVEGIDEPRGARPYEHGQRAAAAGGRADAASQGPGADQADRARCARYAEGAGDRAVVQGDARVHLLGRRVRGRE